MTGIYIFLLHPLLIHSTEFELLSVSERKTPTDVSRSACIDDYLANCSGIIYTLGQWCTLEKYSTLSPVCLDSTKYGTSW